MKHPYPVKCKSAFGKLEQAILMFLLLNVLYISKTNAVVTITRASGGTSISADKAANALSPAYTLLGNVIVTEGSAADFATGTNVTFTLTCPAGWTYNPASAVSVNAPSGDISSANVTSISSTSVSILLTISGTSNLDMLSISGIQVRANEGGNIPAGANIARGGTAVISGCVAGANLGSLSQAAGAINKLVITLPGQSFTDANAAATSGNTGIPASQTAGTPFIITKIRACDQFFNVVTGYFGVKTLTYSGPSSGLTAPAYTTNVSFASGVSSTILTTTLKKSETTAITVSDGTTTGPATTSVTVNPGVINNFLVESSSGGNIGSQVTGIAFIIKLTARDANNNICNSGPNTFAGTADISSTGTLTAGSGTTSAFTSGILSSHTINISNGGSFTITATKTSGAESGTSNTFNVNYPGASISGLTPACVTPGGSSFILTVDGNNFTNSSIVRFNGSNKATTFVNPGRLTATIPSSDIASPGIYSITVFTAGSGTTATEILNMHTGSTANVSICQGSSYVLPDGSSQNTAGTYISVIANAAGCDSTITTNLSVDPSPSRTEFISICPGDSYTLPDGTVQSVAGTYVSTIPNPPLCDSLITTNLSLHAAPQLTVTPVQIDCHGNTGSVILSASNGASPYVYGPEPTSGLSAGTYTYSVTDANGCTDNSSATINSEPSQLTLTTTPVQIACNGGTGSVILSPNGGTPGYSFTNTPVTALIAGTYNYQVTDNNGCTASASAIINPAPAALTATSAATNTPCGSATGSATVTVSGGSSPYTYSWNTIPARLTRTITALPVGTYTVTATDSRGCTITKTATVNTSNSSPVSISGITGICPGGTTTLCANNGFAAYSWSNGAMTQCITVNTADTFTVTVTDTLGCNSTKYVVTHNSTIPTSTISGGELCPNTTLVLRAPIGYPSYLWSNGSRLYSCNVRSAGTYSVTVRNVDGCASTSSFTVNSPMRATISKVDGKCSNEFKGSANVNVAAGTPPYTYQWNNGGTTAAITGLGAGSYNVRITDAGGCTLSAYTTVYSNKTTYDYSTISTAFNTTPVPAGNYLWFTAVASIDYSGSYPVTIQFINQNIFSSSFNLMPPNARLVITNAVTQPSTSFINGEWVTTSPPNATGNYFVSGYATPVNLPIAANLNPVKWKGIWTASSSCVTNIHWKWSAAAYSGFSVNNASINVNPVDNGDPAGTPLNFTGNCIGGGLSTGPSDYVGSYTLIAHRLPCASQDVCQSQRLSAYAYLKDSESNFLVNAYPNPFNSRTNIDFLRFDKSGHLTIDIYSLFGQKVKTIFDGDVEEGVQYTVEFDAAELVSGIYIYRLISDEEEIRGKLYLRK